MHSFVRFALTALAIALFIGAGAVSVFILLKWIHTGRKLSNRMAGISASLWASYLGAVVLLHLVGN